jgi:predicted metal-dependent hydrolase/enoyl-CoA hydratase/carnithine racemase
MNSPEPGTATAVTRELTVRRFLPRFNESIDPHWCGEDPALTHMLNSYTLLVPGNEGFYIRTLQRCAPQLEDLQLREQVDKFVRQEAQHGVGHRHCWRMLDRQGYRYKGFVKAVESFAYGVVERIMPLKLSVSMVACIEHANAFIAHEFLTQNLMAYSQSDLRALFEWHFAEEIEHKGVSFDVLRAYAPSFGTRVLGAALTLPLFYLFLSVGALSLAAQDGSLRTTRFWRGAWRHLWSRDRMAQRTVAHVIDYLRPRFHPWQLDNANLATAAIARWSSKFSVAARPQVSVPQEQADGAIPGVAAGAEQVAVVTASSEYFQAAELDAIKVNDTPQSSLSTPVEAVQAGPERSSVGVLSGMLQVARRASNDEFTRNWYDESNRTYWSVMHDVADAAANATRPCFHSRLMAEMRAFQMSVIEGERARPSDDLAHFVLASAGDVFNLGGDLDLFAKLIRSGDRDRLLAYAELCTRGVHAYHSGFGSKVHTIALVQGDALGGGFEAALSCNTIIAEEGVQLGLPEALFDLFPGMGAYQFLKRRTSAAIAERLIFEGQVLDSRKLHEMGVVDVLVPKGEGVRAVEEQVRRNRRNRHTRMALDHIREWSEPVALEDLLRTTELWVDTALQLGETQLRKMDRLVRAQVSRHGARNAARFSRDAGT